MKTIKHKRGLIKDKGGGYTDIFLFMVLALVIIFISVIFVYMGGKVQEQMHIALDNKTTPGNANFSKLIDESISPVNSAYGSLYWISILLILGMVVAIFMGSYLVTTKPVYFVPYIFIVIIAVVVSAGISNAYDMVRTNPTLASTFEGFVGANYIMLYLPIWIAVVGIIGGIIMYSRLNQGDTLYG
jgi:flagellar biosynthesis protein FliQ